MSLAASDGGFGNHASDDSDFRALFAASDNSIISEHMIQNSLDTELQDSQINGHTNNYRGTKSHSDSHDIRSQKTNTPLEDVISLEIGENAKRCVQSPETCLVTALKVVQTLHSKPSVCLSAAPLSNESSHSQAKLTDSVLTANRESLQIISNTLTCPCSNFPQIQLVLAAICGKLMAWYKAAARHKGGVSRAAVSDPTVESLCTGCDDEQVVHQPITVGGYSFDPVLEQRIRAQMISAELQSVEVVTRSLCSRIEEAQLEDTATTPQYTVSYGLSNAPNPSESDNAVRTASTRKHLSAFLYARLHSVKAEVDELVSCGPDVESESMLVSRQISD